MSNALNADLVICLPVLKKEALAQKKSIEQHLIHLVIHGTLQAQGFDHEDEIEAEAMEELEVKILKSLKQANPYC
jgi:probable rRNA maturation factor